ncbi:MAG: 2-dehydropantoate 2-reductase [SAR116 cluster bacterium]|nr:2-dehydropantoate 2-reductase [SAR116 cluster bacterium]|tara:strand:+ start:1159 stop:2151 length:993 start_codon:yes stop_codon:yes gene_type:complete
MTRICIFGAGAIGGYLAAALDNAGAAVSLVARGPHLEAILKNGLTFEKDGVTSTHHLPASSDPADLGPQDVVFLAVKAHGIPAIIDGLKPLLHDDTIIVPAVNGLPWWYFHGAGTGTALDEQPLLAVDPDRRIWDEIGPQRAIGCVVYPACEIAAPGHVRHLDGDRFSLGEPSGERTDRIRDLSALMIAGGLKAPVRPRIRDEIWIKLWGNCSFNPVSALTGATLDEIGNDPGSRQLVTDIMTEVQAIGEAAGARFGVSIDKRIAGATAIVGHKPSTRQDIEAGRPLEIDPILTAVIELADRLEIEAPALSRVTALLKLQAATLGLYTYP